MNASRIFRSRLVRRCSIAALGGACALAPGAATALAARSGEAGLSPRLTELSQAATRSAPQSEQAARLSLAASGPGSLLRAGSRVLAEVRVEGGAAGAAEALRTAGAEIVDVSARYGTVTVAARPADLVRIGHVAGVTAVTGVLTPVVHGADCGGSVVSEGDVQLNAANARSSFGVDGSGVTVGILSDSFDRDLSAATHAAGDVASGDLPGAGSPCGSSSPVDALDDSESEGGDEGRAMAQIVHDLAPGAAIDFATAFTGEAAFAANIRALAAAGAKVIADDVSYFEEPFFQDGPVADAVNEVAAGGVSYFSAAGNDNLIDKKGRNIASWEAPGFRPAAECPAAIVALSEEVEEAEEEKSPPPPQGLHPTHCMDFDPGAEEDETFGITVEAGQELALDLQWAEPWNGVGTDYDAFLLDEAGEVLESEGSPVLSIEDNVGGSQRPFEFLAWENEGPEQEVQLVVNRFSGGSAGADRPLKLALMENGRGVSETEYPQSAGGDVVGPTVYGHAGAAGAIAVGAVRYSNPAQPERYSSRGPVTHLFGPVGGVVAAAAIPTQTIAKPDVAATDCGATTFFARLEAGVWRFCGTSAAAPHAAAVAALVRQADPAASAAQVRADLVATAHPVGAFGVDDVGAGLIDAYGAVEALALPPTIAITQAPPPLGRNRRPTIQFTANRPVAFTCSIDAGAAQPCSSSYTLPALGDGKHGIAVSGVDLGGRVGTSPVASFTIDTRAPRTTIAKHPPKLVRTHRLKVREAFRFRANEAGATFVCKIDRGLLRFCGSRISRRFDVGRHTVEVRARDAAGNIDRSPAVFHFRVKRVG
jgi:hypothetical protein